ncbi:MAG: 1-acyl-sn-glycerol-3-phosphate acyltransferase [Bacteroidales bacterium]|nr:1-acyl-sn-glycerol-3-phosphate acyltransferase [Bacteroidales bacterium]
MSLRRFIGKIGLKVGGWTTVYNVPADLGNAVCIVAPHTAIEDFFVGIAFFWYYGIPFKVMMKKEFFKPVVGWILKKMGGIPVNRGHQNHLVDQMIDMFSKNKNTQLVICPEGTRKKVTHWKKGFYVIAQGSNVPILVGFIDYKRRCCGIEKALYPSGDYEKDLAEIWDYYRSIKVMGKFPELFNLYEDYASESSC